jgi:hypothetical protein
MSLGRSMGALIVLQVLGSWMVACSESGLPDPGGFDGAATSPIARATPFGLGPQPPPVPSRDASVQLELPFWK